MHPHPNQPGLIFPSRWNERQKAAVATLCVVCTTVCGKKPNFQLLTLGVLCINWWKLNSRRKCSYTLYSRVDRACTVQKLCRGSDTGLHCTVPKIRFMYYQKWNCAASLPIPTFMYLWAICTYIARISLPIWLQQNTVGRPILGIYKTMEIGRQKIITLF